MTERKLHKLPSHLWRTFLVALLAFWISAPLALPSAHAQSADEAEAEQQAAEAQKAAEARRAAKAAAPPSALPGAETQEQDAGHADHDLNPTDALYDAVNRGSLNAAKEALSRGANIYARNILDQTPLDMAIDLNRKDIIFLLLSMRGSDQTGQLANFDDDGSHDVVPTGKDRYVGHVTAKQTVKAKTRYDASGGKPKPEVGFLGFGGK